MNEAQRWRSMAADMRERAAQAQENTIAMGFLALAAEYDRMAEDGAGWTAPSLTTFAELSWQHSR